MRKIILSVMLTVCMVLMLMPQMAFAETSGSTEDGFNYTISDADEVTITGYTGSGDAVVIPKTINGKPVTAIGSNAFNYNLNKVFNSVTIPDGVSSIGERAFYACPYLSSVVLPGSVTSVGDRAFEECNSLSAVFISAQSTISYEHYSFPAMASIVKYSLNQSKHEAIITDIALGHIFEDYYVSSVNIPEQICGYPVTEVALEQRGKVGGHKCAGEDATCTASKTCKICNNTFSPHSYTQENMTLDGALKSAGDCTTEATYYYSCIHCNNIECDDNHTFRGDKDSNTHTGTKVWEQNETQHKKYWNCCNTVETDYEAHTWNDGKCSECDYVCTHKDENENHDCDICGKTISGHTGGTATCIKQAVCSYCKKPYGDIDSSNHNIAKVPSKAPSYSEAGYKEYWQCADCKACFLDEEGSTQIDNIETWKAGPGKIDKLIPPKTDSVTSDRDGNVSVSIEKSIVTTDGKTEASITDAVSESILDKLSSSESKSVVINVSTGSTSSGSGVAAHGTSINISLPESAVKNLAEVEDIRITIETDNGSIVLDKGALEAIASKSGESGTVTLIIETVEQTESTLKLELKIKASSGDVTDFGGGIAAVTVAISDELKGRNPVCVYIDSQGIYHMIGGKLNDDGTFTFATGHFSTYAIMPEEEAASVIKEQTADAQKEAIKKVKPSVSLTTKKVKKGIKVTVKVPASQKADKTGVIIYRSKKKSSGYVEYKRVKTLGSSYTVTNTKNLKGKRLIKGKKYYYKARAYKVIDGKTYYGPMSSIKYAKAR